MSNWFVAAFFVALGLAGAIGVYGVLNGIPETVVFLPGAVAAYWYFTRRYDPGY